jgi:lysophospholipase L1-like esterase
VLARFLRAVAGVVVALAIFFVTGEVLARGLGLVDRLNGYARQLFAAGPSAELPYRLRPGVEATFGGVRVRVNSLGLRGADVAVAPSPGTVRILALGDSVVFGQGVAEDETVTAVLARRLAERWKKPVEVLNSGTQGYDTVAEAAFLAGPGLGLTPSGVVVGMSLNDYDVAPAYDPTGVLTRRSAAPPGLLARSEFLLLLRWLRTWSRGELLTQMLERAGGAERTPTPPTNPTAASIDQLVAREHLRFYRDPDAAAWARLRRGLESLRGTAAARGIWLVVAIFPESYQVGVDAPDVTPQQRLLALCTEAKIACLDLQPAFAAAGGELFQDTQHPNARGHAVAAEAIAAALAR